MTAQLPTTVTRDRRGMISSHLEISERGVSRHTPGKKSKNMARPAAILRRVVVSIQQTRRIECVGVSDSIPQLIQESLVFATARRGQASIVMQISNETMCYNRKRLVARHYSSRLADSVLGKPVA
jgi:hypothetical protein